MYTKLISVETKAQFELIQQSESPFPRSSIVIIEDTQQIWTHGVFINGVTPTEVSADVTLNIAGTDYKVALADHFHKKTQNVDLGLHSYTEVAITYPISYSVVASTHTLLYYSEKGSIYTGVHIGNKTDKVIFDSSQPLYRIYTEGIITRNIPILDGSNVNITPSENTIQYNFASVYSGTIYYAQHDKSSAAPQLNSSLKTTRLGGNSTEGWVVMNTAMAGGSDNYYQIRITNLSSPELFIKPSSYTNFTKVMTINDVFTGGTSQAEGTAGIVPAPPANDSLYLKSDGQWSSVLPSTNSSDVYLYKNSQGVLEWTSIRMPDEVRTIIPVSFAINSSWREVAEADLPILLDGTGTYAINILYGSSYYSGVASIVTDTVIETGEEVLLHECGGNVNTHLYAKIAPRDSDGKAGLWLASSNPLDNYSLTISFRKLL